VLGIIFFMGSVSGAHLNPAVTLAFAVHGTFPWLRVPGYIFAQLVGAVSASLFLHQSWRLHRTWVRAHGQREE
jgi:aquaporin Z